MFNFLKKEVQIPIEMPRWNKGNLHVFINDYPNCIGLKYGVTISIGVHQCILDTSLDYADALILFNKAKRKANKEFRNLTDKKSLSLFFCDLHKVSTSARNEILSYHK